MRVLLAASEYSIGTKRVDLEEVRRKQGVVEGRREPLCGGSGVSPAKCSWAGGWEPTHAVVSHPKQNPRPLKKHRAPD